MSKITTRFKRFLVCAAVTGMMLTAIQMPSRSEGPMVPAPKLPPPSNCVYGPDGTIYYPDGTILYPNGTYVYPDGRTGSL